MLHTLLVITVKKRLTSVYIYRSYRRNKKRVSAFGTRCIGSRLTETAEIVSDTSNVDTSNIHQSIIWWHVTGRQLNGGESHTRADDVISDAMTYRTGESWENAWRMGVMTNERLSVTSGCREGGTRGHESKNLCGRVTVLSSNKNLVYSVCKLKLMAFFKSGGSFLFHTISISVFLEVT